jgi:hypothetical protein
MNSQRQTRSNVDHARDLRLIEYHRRGLNKADVGRLEGFSRERARQLFKELDLKPYVFADLGVFKICVVCKEEYEVGHYHDHIVDAGHEYRRTRLDELSERDHQVIVYLYERGFGYKVIGQEFGRKPTTIKRIIELHGITPRSIQVANRLRKNGKTRFAQLKKVIEDYYGRETD